MSIVLAAPDGTDDDWGKATGWVYCIAGDTPSRVKIGYSNNPEKRLKQLQTSNPEKLKILWVFRGTIASERFIHSLLTPHRLAGEWFALPETFDVMSVGIELSDMAWNGWLQSDRSYGSWPNYEAWEYPDEDTIRYIIEAAR